MTRMSLKNVELQIAIPKTYEAGKMADNAQQYVNGNQQMAQMATEKQAQRNLTTVLETEDTSTIGDEHPDKRKQEQHLQAKKGKQQSKEHAAQHPFKGNFFDFSG